jgi:hypothetical protein
MADYFVASGGSNTAPYDTWAKAATSLQTALTAASTAGDRVIIQYNGVPSGDAELSADTTYTLANSIQLIASTNSGTATITPTAMGTSYWIGNSTTNRGITLAGAYAATFSGLTLRTSGSTSDIISLKVDLAEYNFYDCYIWSGNTGGSSYIDIGAASVAVECALSFFNCTFRFGNAAANLKVGGAFTYFSGCSFAPTGTVPTTLFVGTHRAAVLAEGCDFSGVTTTLVGAMTNGGGEFRFANCKIGSGVVVLGAPASNNRAQGMAWLFNCALGDTHYALAHYDALGSTVVDTGIYANDGAQYDGTNRCSWKIVTTAYATPRNPYFSPWIDRYHSASSAITPYLEILRDGSATAYTNAEVWGEFSYQGTSGYTQSTLVNDRVAFGATAADQTASSKGASDWTGDAASAWFGKLNPTATITPAEIGHLRARIAVAAASSTVYVDPTIRGTS